MSFPFPELLVFDLANNHQGSFEHGLGVVQAIAKVARQQRVKAAIKLQYRDLDTFIHPHYVDREDVKHIPRFMQTRLSWDEFEQLVSAIKEQGLLAMVTPFDEPSVDRALAHGVDVLKVASCSCLDWPLLEVIAAAPRPVIVSTGGCRLRDIDKIVSFLEHRGVSSLALLHCVGIYPTNDEDQQLRFMQRMMERYPHCTIGYSGHEAPGNLRVATAAVAMGARILERHVGLPTDEIQLNAYSMSPEQAAFWVETVVTARRMCEIQSGDKAVRDSEVESLRSLARGVFARQAIKNGEALTPDRVFFALPCAEGQTSTREYLETITASRDYEALAPIRERRERSPIQAVRTVVHEVRGLLREAKIPVGTDFQVELSHHYGMSDFWRCGATIVNYFNREYCKKLIVLLPGQRHPSHAHQKKEETFQVLHGKLELVLCGEGRTMLPGDIQLVRRGDYHSFSTSTGCVFEEISTTHIKGDSIYEDEQIRRLDPIERKTVIEAF